MSFQYEPVFADETWEDWLFSCVSGFVFSVRATVFLALPALPVSRSSPIF